MRGTNDLSFYQDDATSHWRWRLRSGTNGKIIAASTESFHNLKDCLNSFLFTKRPFQWSMTYAKGARMSKLTNDEINRLLGQ